MKNSPVPAFIEANNQSLFTNIKHFLPSSTIPIAIEMLNRGFQEIVEEIVKPNTPLTQEEFDNFQEQQMTYASTCLLLTQIAAYHSRSEQLARIKE